MTAVSTRAHLDGVHVATLDGTDPVTLLRALPGEHGTVGLVGQWAGGGAVIALDPVRTTGLGATLDDVLQADVEAADPNVLGGGWFGWMAYPEPDAAPDHWFGLYPNVLRYRSSDRRWYDEAMPGIVADDELDRRRDALVQWAHAAARSDPATHHVGMLRPDVTKAQYCAAVERCIAHIRAGDVYQANICQRLGATFDGDPAALFADLVAALEPAYAALVVSDDTTVVSLSPELFLGRVGDVVTSRPIKGTRPRRAERQADPAVAELHGCAKERAENIMIVDLVRNDLARIARTGSVTVPSLLQVEPHCGVWHLVSEVRAECRAGCGDSDLIAAAYPAGSVTGAPKHSARRIIAGLESSSRGVYTGSVGYVARGRLELNVAIRTLEIVGHRLELGVGAGITASSVPVLEWQECMVKAAPLAAAMHTTLDVDIAAPTAPGLVEAGVFETLLVLDGRPVELTGHLERLSASATELWSQSVPNLAAWVIAEAQRSSWPAARLRVDLRRGPDGRPELSCVLSQILRPSTLAAHAGIRLPVVVVAEGFGRHKWADRTLIDGLESRFRGSQVLAVDADGRCLETTRGSVVAIVGNRLVTPPLDGRILPGVTRRSVLDAAVDLGLDIDIRAITLAELTRAEGVAVGNSLAGLTWVRWCEGRSWHQPSAQLADLAAAIEARWTGDLSRRHRGTRSRLRTSQQSYFGPTFDSK